VPLIEYHPKSPGLAGWQDGGSLHVWLDGCVAGWLDNLMAGWVARCDLTGLTPRSVGADMYI